MAWVAPPAKTVKLADTGTPRSKPTARFALRVTQMANLASSECPAQYVRVDITLQHPSRLPVHLVNPAITRTATCLLNVPRAYRGSINLARTPRRAMVALQDASKMQAGNRTAHCASQDFI